MVQTFNMPVRMMQLSDVVQISYSLIQMLCSQHAMFVHGSSQLFKCWCMHVNSVVHCVYSLMQALST